MAARRPRCAPVAVNDRAPARRPPPARRDGAPARPRAIALSYTAGVIGAARPDDDAGGDDAIRIGVSACLTGAPVRYDGGHKLHPFVRDALGAVATLVPVCPEVEVGLGVPRPTLRLVQPACEGGPLRLIAPATGADHTEAMTAWTRDRVRALAALGLCGHVFRRNSPSCGLWGVPVYPRADGGRAVRTGRGAFAAAFTAALPDLPVEEDGRLDDPARRESFVARVFAYRRARAALGPGATAERLATLRARDDLLVEAHAPGAGARLDAIVTAIAAQRVDPAAAAGAYVAELMRALARPSTDAKRARALARAVARAGRGAPAAAAARDAIRAYRHGLVSFSHALGEVRRLARARGDAWLASQTWLFPEPGERRLRALAGARP
ncbi:MAG: DUF523 domain-containing protein [Deltaproteobacteria bacterium]|nr:MAG: DUF523 domain-containing protein [Deltaproteobacteria bacterium]